MNFFESSKIIDYFFIVFNINNLFTPTVNFDVSKIESWHVLRGENNLVGAWRRASSTFVCFFGEASYLVRD